jgi:hypothetical protein
VLSGRSLGSFQQFTLFGAQEIQVFVIIYLILTLTEFLLRASSAAHQKKYFALKVARFFFVIIYFVTNVNLKIRLQHSDVLKFPANIIRRMSG